MAKDEQKSKEELKNLPPEERIKKLKELERQRKKEIEEAQKIIRDSEKEITERIRWNQKVPIPEFAQEEVLGLGEEGKEILRQKGVRLVEEKIKVNKSNDKEDNDKIGISIKRGSSDLEDAVSESKGLPSAQGNVQYGPQEQQAFGVAYKPLSQLDIKGISSEIKNIYQAVEQRGYITGQEQKLVGYALSEVERRLEDADAGRYKGFTEEVAEAASLIQRIGKQMYHAGGSNRMYQA